MSKAKKNTKKILAFHGYGKYKKKHLLKCPPQNNLSGYHDRTSGNFVPWINRSTQGFIVKIHVQAKS